MRPQAVPALQRRAMRVQDLDAVMAVEASAYSHPWSRGNFTDSLAAGYLAEVLLDGDGALLGYFVAMCGVDEMHLLNITVAPAAQGRGHGTLLLQAVRQHAHALQLAMLWLEVRQSNVRALGLYRRHGWQERGIRRGYYPAAGRREDAVVMSLDLGGDGGDRGDGGDALD